MRNGLSSSTHWSGAHLPTHIYKRTVCATHSPMILINGWMFRRRREMRVSKRDGGSVKKE